MEVNRRKSDQTPSEFVVDLNYLPPFNLYNELEHYIKKSQSDSEQRSSERGECNKFLEMYQKFSGSGLENNWLMLDVINLRLSKPELFWNLIYRFHTDNRDFAFLLPYEMDMFPEMHKEANMEEYKMQVKDYNEDEVEQVIKQKINRADTWKSTEDIEDQDKQDDEDKQGDEDLTPSHNEKEHDIEVDTNGEEIIIT